MISRIASLWTCALALSACTADDLTDDATDGPSVSEGQQAIGISTGIGDLNGDGVIDGKDAVQYLTSWGFQIRTYGLTDDDHNTGDILAHRQYDKQVKMYADACLPSGAHHYPPEDVPGIKDTADAFSRLPTQYLRELGKEQYTLFFVGEKGRLAKRWKGQANGTDMQLVFYHSTSTPSGIAGAALFGPDTGAGYTTAIDQITLEGFTGNWTTWTGGFSFRRPDVNQLYHGTVNGDGTAITMGTFTQNGSGNFTFDASAYQTKGGATAIAGFGGGNTNCAADAFTVGHTNPGIALQIGFDRWTAVGSVGVAVRALVDVGALGTTPFEQLLENTFPWTGNPAAACAGCKLLGTGYVTNVAAGVNTPNDFSETFATWFEARALLDSRVAEDYAVHDYRLWYKRDFIDTTIDIPDPGIALEVHPASGVMFRARAYSATASHPATSIYSGSLLTPTLVSDGSKLWMFTSTANHGVSYSTLDTQGHAAAPSGTLPLTSTVPIAATLVAPGKIALFGATDGVVWWKFFNTATASLSAGNSLPNPATSAPLGIATVGTTTWLFLVDTNGSPYYEQLSYTGPSLIDSHGGFHPMDNSITATAIAAAPIPHQSSPTTISIVAIDTVWNVHYIQLNPNGVPGLWQYDPVGVSAVATPTVDRNNQLYIKGFDGNFYTKPLGLNLPYSLVGP